MCETDQGCPISDIAPSVRGNQIINAYLDYRLSTTAKKLSSVRRQILDRGGLLKHPDLLCALDLVFDTWRNHARRKADADRQFATQVKNEASFRRR